MDCTDIKTYLSGYIEDDLPVDIRSAIEEHIRSCTSCSGIVSELLSYERLISKEKTTIPNPFAGTRILHRLESELESKNYHRRMRHRHILQPALVTFGLILALFIGFIIGREKGLNVNSEYISTYQIENLRSDLFISEFIDENQTLLSNK